MTYTVKFGAVTVAKGITLTQFVRRFELATASLKKAKAYRLYED